MKTRTDPKSPKTMSETKIRIKLLIDSKTNRVLFAEAGKGFADFLFTLLSLPVGSVVRLLSSNAMVGTIGKLYDSFRDLNDTYILPQVNKDTLLKPSSSLGNNLSFSPSALVSGSDELGAQCPSCIHSMSTVLKYVAPPKADVELRPVSPRINYICDYCNNYGSDGAGAYCPSCREYIGHELSNVAPPKAKVRPSSSSEGGFVKGVVTYMVMDDLEVKPMSTISSIAMLNKFNVSDVGALQEKTVSVGMKEGLKLLKSSLETKSVLTNVFLEK